ncbi:MAG: Asp-tRNA(Asn)/Glu-tRNA(Gln) amidotransferase subunit GatC [Deltaproteobacteria bacterium]|nr:Asp-tRNA(Asn)/Glu-tRNA(Gln) amidotransferase subunit GatC [Deltaproteobacteria bacterium]
MPVSLEDVDHIARLARLGLTDEERTALRGELESILGYVEQLAKLDTGGVEPTASMRDDSTPTRPDRTSNDDDAEKLVERAPDRQGTYLRVPKIIEASE